MKDRPRSDEPSAIPKEEMDEIKQELSDSNTVWDFKHVISSSYLNNIIKKKCLFMYFEIYGKSLPCNIKNLERLIYN